MNIAAYNQRVEHSQREDALEALKRLRDLVSLGDPMLLPRPSAGVCDNFLALRKGRGLPVPLYSLFRTWPLGSVTLYWYFPIPGYTEHLVMGTLWVGEQRDLRLSLINHLINTFEGNVP